MATVVVDVVVVVSSVWGRDNRTFNTAVPKWAAERQRYFGDSTDITDVFQDYESLVKFLISSGHLSPHIGSA